MIGSEEVIWLKLLTILFLLYFPVKLMTQLVLDFSQRYYERRITIYLTKSLLTFVVQSKELGLREENEKLNILVNSVPNFSRQFLNLFLNFTDIIVSILLELFSLFFLIL